MSQTSRSISRNLSPPQNRALRLALRAKPRSVKGHVFARQLKPSIHSNQMKPTQFTHNFYTALAAVLLNTALAFSAETNLVFSSDPQADALLSRHVQEVGGEAALQKITSRRISGTLERHGKMIPFVRTQKAPAFDGNAISKTGHVEAGLRRQGRLDSSPRPAGPAALTSTHIANISTKLESAGVSATLARNPHRTL
ncbi:MAG: hypothetical protein ACTHLW_01800 [Verrucomicrobiota bacterium]